MNLDSDELQVYASVAVTVVVWAALCLSGWSSLQSNLKMRPVRGPGLQESVVALVAWLGAVRTLRHAV